MADKDATSQDAAAQALADAAQAGNTDLSSETSHAIDAAYKENMASSIKSSTKIELKARKDTTVLIICGGLSHERDISLSSGHRVGGFLEDAGWHVVFHDMDSDLIEYLNNPNTCPDIVWPLLHGANGEDGSIRDVLEMVGLPYIGSRAKASRTAWSKPIAKNVVRKLGGLNTPHSVTLPESMFRELGAGKVIDLLVQSMGLP
ncbi:MAG: D-alanine--D-alanine ligase, partial [Bifidobacterium tsurumiense]|nr:D-alanine--D-alanine ligase [Bifidobacterium tsurumiense]